MLILLFHKMYSVPYMISIFNVSGGDNTITQVRVFYIILVMEQLVIGISSKRCMYDCLY